MTSRDSEYISCSDCGSLVDKKASKCPLCGSDQRKQKPAKNRSAPSYIPPSTSQIVKEESVSPRARPRVSEDPVATFKIARRPYIILKTKYLFKNEEGQVTMIVTNRPSLGTFTLFFIIIPFAILSLIFNFVMFLLLIIPLILFLVFYLNRIGIIKYKTLSFKTFEGVPIGKIHSNRRGTKWIIKDYYQNQISQLQLAGWRNKGTGTLTTPTEIYTVKNMNNVYDDSDNLIFRLSVHFPPDDKFFIIVPSYKLEIHKPIDFNFAGLVALCLIDRFMISEGYFRKEG